MTDELKPCPCCRGDAEMDTQQAFRALADGRIGHACAIYCVKCSLTVSWCYADVPELSHEDVAREVTEAWNRRAP